MDFPKVCAVDILAEKGIESCSICLEQFSDDHIAVETPCGHFFGDKCLEKWVNATSKRKADCPMCRAVLVVKPVQVAPSGAMYINDITNFEHAIVFVRELLMFIMTDSTLDRSQYHNIQNVIIRSVNAVARTCPEDYPSGLAFRNYGVVHDLVHEMIEVIRDATDEFLDSVAFWCTWVEEFAARFDWQFEDEEDEDEIVEHLQDLEMVDDHRSIYDPVSEDMGGVEVIDVQLGYMDSV